MQGLYLYCIREKANGAGAVRRKGIDGNGCVFVLSYHDLEAVVSTVCLEEFDLQVVRRKAHEDLKWIKEVSIAHEEIIEQAMRNNGRVFSLLPMRFGTVFRDRASLEHVLDEDYVGIQETLERIRGKQEWSVKVYLTDREEFERAVRKENVALRQKAEEIASLPEGMAFLMEEELKTITAQWVQKGVSDVINSLFDELAKHSVASVKNRILQKELTGRREPMVLNSAYLVCEEKVPNLKEEAETVKQRICKKGLHLEYSGPWPAFNFTSY